VHRGYFGVPSKEITKEELAEFERQLYADSFIESA
jgi:hypothetical protein